MNLIESHLSTRYNQFGFKKKHSTDLCIFTVKSVIRYYNLYNSPAFWMPQKIGHCLRCCLRDQFQLL